MFRSRKYSLLAFSILAFCISLQGQDVRELSSIWSPANCEELEKFTKTVLDSSYFFKGNIAAITDAAVGRQALSSCEYYAHLLTVQGFHSYISNDVYVSRTALLKADSIYNSQKNSEHRYFIRNKVFLGLNYNVANDTIKSLRYLKEAESIAQKVDTKMLADAKQNLAVVYLNSGETEKAEIYAKEALALAKLSHNHEIAAFANVTLSRIHRSRKQWNDAINKVQNASRRFEALGDTRNLYVIEYTYGEIYMEKGDTSNAIQNFISALELGDTTNHIFQHGIIYMQLARLFEPTNNEKAIEYFEKALENYTVLNKSEFSILVETLTSYYTKTRDFKKQNQLVKNLTNFHNLQKDELRVELLESNQQEVNIQKEVNANKILQLKNETNRNRLRIIFWASTISFLLALYAFGLLRRNRGLNKKISAQNRQLQNQNAELKNFASIASHDLKAPVRSITSFASLVERLLPPDSNPRIYEYLKIINKSSSNMNDLVNSLLEFSTIENRQLELSRIAIKPFINEVLNNLYTLIETKQAEIIVSDNLPVIINGDETLLKIVFQNLINNALKFVADGVTPKVQITYSSADGMHYFRIIDNGIGIEKEYLEKIFLIFERLHSSKDYEGSGIGLATCKKIMLLHNGTIDIASSDKTGTTFVIGLPKILS